MLGRDWRMLDVRSLIQNPKLKKLSVQGLDLGYAGFSEVSLSRLSEMDQEMLGSFLKYGESQLLYSLYYGNPE